MPTVRQHILSLPTTPLRAVRDTPTTKHMSDFGSSSAKRHEDVNFRFVFVTGFGQCEATVRLVQPYERRRAPFDAYVSVHHRSNMLTLGLAGGRRRFFTLMYFAVTGT